MAHEEEEMAHEQAGMAPNDAVVADQPKPMAESEQRRAESERDGCAVLAQSRRGFLASMGGAGALTAAAATIGLGGGLLAAPEKASAREGGSHGNRRVQAFLLRQRAAQTHLLEKNPPQISNGDEQRYADKRASFSKCLPHDELGEVDVSAYQSLVAALDSGRPADYEAIPLSSSAERRLANPQAARAFDMMGRDSHATLVPPAAAFASDESAAEMGELYWQSLSRDVPFIEYEASDVIAAAVEDLNSFSVILAPTEGGEITPGTVFRGNLPADLVGPYASQFFWMEVPYGPSTIVQRYGVPLAGIDFMTGYDEWLAIQRGAAPVSPLAFDPTPRYVYNGRSLGEYVHVDVLFQAYFNAAMSLSRYGSDAFDRNNPYLGSDNQGGFVTFGGPHLFDMVAKAARVALEGAWYHKWEVHRRLRPEAYAGRIENQLAGAKHYGIPGEILDSDAPVVPGGLPYAPRLSGGPLHGGRCLRDRPQGLRRRGLRDPRSGAGLGGRFDAAPVERGRPHPGRRDRQAGHQHQHRSLHGRRALPHRR
jgi:hypothetical protein